MSRAYWVNLTSAVTQTIEGSDRSVHKVNIEEIVPGAELDEILRGALEDSGWEKSDDGTYKKEVESVTLSWDLEKGEVEAKVQDSREVTRDVSVEGRAYSQEAAQRNAERQLLQREETAKDAIEAEQEQLQRCLLYTSPSPRDRG